jgi:hypothetical protein
MPSIIASCPQQIHFVHESRFRHDHGLLGVPAVNLGNVNHGFHVFRIGLVESRGRHDKTAIFTAYRDEVSAIVLYL